jgi:hypothetical protein
MKKYLFITLALFQLIFLGCKKEEVDLKPILTSQSWEEFDTLNNGEINILKTIYKATFDPGGEVEIIYRCRGVRPGDPIGFVRFDTLKTEYNLLDSERRITFKPINEIVSDTTNILFNECDSMQYFMEDWQIQKINSDFLETHGLTPDTTNHAHCMTVFWSGGYKLRPYTK